jgi:4-diphosphocytidyl-2-C-methyl-D-erythritol kinase
MNTVPTFSIDSPAKINLFLRIVGRRPDGYHEIETLFQRIDLVDRLEFRPLPKSATQPGAAVRLRLSQGVVPGLDLSDNLITRAWTRLAERLGVQPPPVEIVLDKKIPLGGGLGGGSSNAAATLRAFQALHAPKAEPGLVGQVALGLGADVPFFLGPPAAIGRGIGERLETLPHSCRFWLALAFPEYGVGTADAYRAYRPEARHDSGDLPGLIQALQTGNGETALELCFNEMEELAFGIRPELGMLRDALEKASGQPVRMSGSGSTLYTFGPEKNKIKNVVQHWQDAFGLRTVLSSFRLD